MRYLNPLDLFKIPLKSISELDSIIIKKSKKRILAEIELSDDNSINIKNQKFNKSDILKSFDELEDDNKKEFYFFLYNYKELNNFLFNGETKFFINFRHESIFNLSKFIDFISPYYAPKYSELLIKALEKKSVKALNILNSLPLLVNNDFKDQAFQGAYNYIQNKIKWLEQISKNIKNETSEYNEENICKLDENIKDKIHHQSINLLPFYFQESRNNLSFALRNLSIDIFNNIGDAEVSISMIRFALGIKIDGLSNDKIRHDLTKIEEINLERKETEKYEPTLKKYALLFVNSKKFIEKIDNKDIRPTIVLQELQKNIDIFELNSLPSLFDEVRIQLALTLRNLSVSTWNMCNDVETSIVFIEMALKIEIPNDLKNKIEEDKYSLSSLLEEKKKFGEPIKSAPSLKLINGCGTIIYGKTLYFVLFGIPILPIARYSYDKTYTGQYKFYGKLQLYTLQKIWKYSVILLLCIWLITVILNSNNSSSSNYSYNESGNNYKSSSYSQNESGNNNSTNENWYKLDETGNLSKYKGNSLKNGTSPYDSYFGKGIYNKSHQNWIHIETDKNFDAVVCLVNYYSGKTIRNEYIRAGSSFQMTNVPNGTYYIKEFFGKDWNPNKKFKNGSIKGGFDTDFHFSESSSSNDVFKLQDNGYQYSTIHIKLSVIGGNMKQSTINEYDFFK